MKVIKVEAGLEECGTEVEGFFRIMRLAGNNRREAESRDVIQTKLVVLVKLRWSGSCHWWSTDGFVAGRNY
jgi:hypothetical protein